VSPQTGLLKSTLLQLDSTFSERTYGASSFLDFTEKLAHAGLVHLKQAGRSVMVELNPLFEEGEAADQKVRTTEEGQPPADAVQALGRADTSRPTEHGTPPIATESAAEGVRLVGEILQKATGARWPMYIRNVKQILRAADGSFDERRYGFGGLMDLLRACQRDGVLRLERDRRGGLRVFPGAALQRPAGVPGEPVLEPFHAEPAFGKDDDAEQPLLPVEGEPADLEGIPIDTTAELLGRAKPRRPRAKAPAEGSARRASRATSAPGAPGPRRPAARRAARSKKAAAEPNDDNS
jgi:hypothetical protein